MNRIINFLVIGLALVSMHLDVAAQTSSSQLVGAWQVDWQKMSAAMTTEELDRYNTMSEDIRSKARNSFSSRIFAFNLNGEVQISWAGSAGQRTVAGTWSVNNDLLELIVSGQQRKYEVTLVGSTLTLTMLDLIEGATFSKIVLNRLN